jgi:hypothetical protein
MLKLAKKKAYVYKGFDQGPGGIGRSLRSACLYTYIRISQHVRNTMSVIETVQYSAVNPDFLTTLT